MGEQYTLINVYKNLTKGNSQTVISYRARKVVSLMEVVSSMFKILKEFKSIGQIQLLQKINQI
jgi:hypothetical protein